MLPVHRHMHHRSLCLGSRWPGILSRSTALAVACPHMPPNQRRQKRRPFAIPTPRRHCAGRRPQRRQMSPRLLRSNGPRPHSGLRWQTRMTELLRRCRARASAHTRAHVCGGGPVGGAAAAEVAGVRRRGAGGEGAERVERVRVQEDSRARTAAGAWDTGKAYK